MPSRWSFSSLDYEIVFISRSHSFGADYLQDAYTMSRTMAGENMINALDARLTKVRSTSTELERVGAFYSRIIELCVSNPPKDNRHLRALEEQVKCASVSQREGSELA